jgi:DNA processing protein
LLELSDEELIAALAGKRGDQMRRWLDGFEPARARTAVESSGLDAACRHSQFYPRPLLRLPDPPAVLYVAGGIRRLEALMSEPVATVVGGRGGTAYALEVAAALGRGLAAAGVTVVSGLALGVDGAVHRGALRAGDSVLAVLACGAEMACPRSHLDLYRRVRARGVVVSELPVGVRPMRWSFPARNRIMAALGQITVVVEAGEPSGSLITAGFATSLGRGVGAVPGLVTSRKGMGSNRLLRDGATVIRGAEDVLDELFGVGAGADDVSSAEAARRRALAASDLGAPTPEDLDAPLRRVLEAVEAGQRLDAIGRVAGLPPGEVRAALGRLELLGLVARDRLGLYERAAG